MSRSGEHLLSLIDEILEISKIESGHVTLTSADFNLHRLVETIIDMFRLRAEKKGLSLTVEREDGLPNDLIQHINVAAKGAMSKKLLDLLEQIPPDFNHVADAMADLVGQFRFSEIISMTEKEGRSD